MLLGDVAADLGISEYPAPLEFGIDEGLSLFDCGRCDWRTWVEAMGRKPERGLETVEVISKKGGRGGRTKEPVELIPIPAGGAAATEHAQLSESGADGLWNLQAIVTVRPYGPSPSQWVRFKLRDTVLTCWRKFSRNFGLDGKSVLGTGLEGYLFHQPASLTVGRG